MTLMAQSLTALDTSTKRSESKQMAYKCNLCEFESAFENDVSIHIEYGHRKGYNETDLETNLADKIPQIDGKVDDETAEEEAQVKELIEYQIKLVKNEKLKNMSEKELVDLKVEISICVMIKMLELQLFHTFSCKLSNIQATVNNVMKNYMKAS